MAGSVNKVTIVGNLGKDPEIRTTQAGGRIASLTIATSESWTDKASGERKEKTEWHRVSVFNERIADVCERFLTKGRKVYVEGSLQTRKWTDKDGKDNYTTEIVIDRFKGDLVILDSNRGEQSDRPAQPAPKETPKEEYGHSVGGGVGSDEIPF